ncbi:hypothetical protein CAPTEDRAFT_197757 [Capitella teleta]|uniref:Uncharacterized protein n=1 Tax=Capitella teleta TaxID=283909 RepID=R7T929_CAPTE|nr:hypothetical protein CAPTEDRAFT_197757 [Capitella teleta]|eukprot:ELT90238.1 hypothetical protein CAPTEDRAFT_197757 [Capitella teleta]
MPNTTEKINGHVVTPSFPEVTCEHARQPSISHIDFWPTSETKVLKACDASFESFGVLVERANRWLNQFPECSLISIETTDKKVIDVSDIYSSSTYFTDDEDLVLATHIKGLR